MRFFVLLFRDCIAKEWGSVKEIFSWAFARSLYQTALDVAKRQQFSRRKASIKVAIFADSASVYKLTKR
jgi:hypothetical protein